MADLPIVAPEETQIDRGPVPAADVWLVRVRHVTVAGAGTDPDSALRPALRPMPPLHALRELHEAALAPPRHDLGGLVHPGRCFELFWCNPVLAARHLASIMGG